MNSTTYNFLQRHGMRLTLCALALSCATASFAQDEFDEEETITVKKPKKKSVDKNPTVEVKGVVVEESTRRPIAGVRIQALNDNRYTSMTDAEGKFTIKVPTFATALYVEAPRHMSQQVAIRSNDPKQTVMVSMLSNAFEGMYENGTTITAKNSITTNGGGVTIDEEIANRLGGDIHAVMHSGNLDQGAAMYIRGISSLNAGTQPLIIIDGVEIDMQRDRLALHQGDIFNMLTTISPEDIDKVTVLKNATALYGARGANGVILIDTKRGHSMATRIDVKASAGVSLIPHTPNVMDANQYRSYAVEQLGTIDKVVKAQNSSSTMINFKFLNDNPTDYYYPWFHNNTDWQDYIYREAITQNYSINVQGGDDIGMYHLSVGYTQADKNVKESSFDRINVRFNTDISLLEKLSTKFDISFSKTNTTLFDDGVNEDLTKAPATSPSFLARINSPLIYPYQYNPNIKGFTPLLSDPGDETAPALFGDLGSEYALGNPVALIKNGEGDRKNKNENTFFNVTITPKYEINNHLSVASHFSYYLNRNSQAYYRPNIGMAAFFIENLGTVYSKTASIFSNETNIISNTHIDWHNKYGAHDVAVFGGFRYNMFSFNSSNLSSDYQVRGIDDKNPQLNADGASAYSNVFGIDDNWKNMQWYVNGDYNYKNRYFATLSVLAEANSRFGSKASGALKAFGTPWAIFPSVQLGWVMTNEDWFPKNSGIDYLRINAGFDVSGNDNISNYATKTSFEAVRYMYKEIGVQMVNVGNDEVKWETTSKWNFGLQANMLNNRLGVNFNYYIHNTSNLLSLKSFDNPIGGINNYWINDGKLRNAGYEVAVNAKPVAMRDLSLEIGASVGHYETELRKLAGGSYTSSIYGDNNILTEVGRPVGVFYGYETHDRVLSTSAEAAAAGVSHVNKEGVTTSNLYYVDKTGAKVDFVAGDTWFVDRNQDGCIDEADKTVIGNPNPDIYGNIFATLTYKRFKLNLGFNYSLGNDVYNYERTVMNSGSTLYNQQVAEIGRWRYEGQITSIPRVCYGDPKGNNRFSDRWIEDGSYLRLKTLSLSYNIPVPESWQSWLQGISVWGECHNLFTLTHYTGSDPEFSISNNHFYQGIDAGNLAQTRSFTLGLKVNL